MSTFETLTDLMSAELVTPATRARILRLAKIVARREGRTVADVLEAAK